MTDRRQPAENAAKKAGAQPMPIKGVSPMKSILYSTFAILLLVGICAAKDLPNAPSAVESAEPYIIESTAPAFFPAPQRVETKIVDIRFTTLALVSTGATFADSYTTLFARQNWLAGKKGVCNAEVQSAYLYGTHPTAGRVYAIASAKSAGSILAAYYLRKHHSKLWSLPLVANSFISLQGTTQNMINCN